jgi:hypothetical protein
MSTQEHLDLIIEHCEKNLEIAKKRTPGKWHKTPKCNVQKGTIMVAECHETFDGEIGGNASYIAACSRSAEAGWRATIALCNLMMWLLTEPITLDSDDETALNELLESFPIESL